MIINVMAIMAVQSNSLLLLCCLVDFMYIGMSQSLFWVYLPEIISLSAI